MLATRLMRFCPPVPRPPSPPSRVLQSIEKVPVRLRRDGRGRGNGHAGEDEGYGSLSRFPCFFAMLTFRVLCFQSMYGHHGVVFLVALRQKKKNEVSF